MAAPQQYLRSSFALPCRAALLLLAGAILGSHPSWAETPRPFIVFDGLLYTGKPDTRARGLVPISWVGDIWRPGVPTDTVDAAQVRAVFEHEADKSGYYYLDIENWPLLSVSPATRRQNIAKLTQVIELARSALPSAHLGFYGLLPGITYWPLMRHDAAFAEWLQVNRDLEPLAGRVDAVYPSLYTFYDDVEGWKSYARQTLAEARRFGKPVYVFLWPQFHDSNPQLRGHDLPREFWRAELQLCAELADGVVLWGGWQTPWDERAAWWQETLAFMQTLPRGSRAPRPDAP
jgi:hypothetical protein